MRLAVRGGIVWPRWHACRVACAHRTNVMARPLAICGHNLSLSLENADITGRDRARIHMRDSRALLCCEHCFGKSGGVTCRAAVCAFAEAHCALFPTFGRFALLLLFGTPMPFPVLFPVLFPMLFSLSFPMPFLLLLSLPMLFLMVLARRCPGAVLP